MRYGVGRLSVSTSAKILRFLRDGYEPPYDRREKHMPHMNFCGPGTNVTRRLAEGVKPMDKLDAACLKHDIVTEPRGPYTSKGNPRLLRKADKNLLRTSLRLLAEGYEPAWQAKAVASAMSALLLTGARGRKV